MFRALFLAVLWAAQAPCPRFCQFIPAFSPPPGAQWPRKWDQMGEFSQPLLRHLLGTQHTALPFHLVSNHSALRKPPLSPQTEDRPRLRKMKHLPNPLNSKVAQQDWNPQFPDSEVATLSTTAPPRPRDLKTEGSLERRLLCSLHSGSRETGAPHHVFPRPIHAESATARKFAQVHYGCSGWMSGSAAHASREGGRPRQRSLRHRGGATASPPDRQAR